MFKNIIVALFVSEAAAVAHHHHHHHKYRPNSAQSPWHEDYEQAPQAPLVTSHTHYQVPAMGFANDMVPKSSKEPWTYPTSLTQARSDPICSSAGCTQYEHPAPPKGHPMDYFVPSFGRDPDMEGTEDSIDIAQKMIGHKIIMGTDESKAKWHNVAKDTLYNYHPELDYDIRVSNTNEAAAEQTLGTSMYP